MSSHNSRTWRALKSVALSCLLAIFVPAILPEIVSAACPSEYTLFVMASGSNLYYGNRDATFTYYDVPTCDSTAVNAQSTFLRASDDFTSFVETGARIDGTGTTHYWTEWRSWPGPVVSLNYDSQGHPGVGSYYSFKITYTGSPGYFGMYWGAGSDPSTVTWHFLAVSDKMPRNRGQAESEEAHLGPDTGDRYTTVQKLATQTTSGGSWFLWNSLVCDESQNNMPGWYAHKLSNSSWATNKNSPGIC